ncbi:MAG: lipid-A-disaccharide synthase [Planctomycetota bacterium]
MHDGTAPPKQQAEEYASAFDPTSAAVLHSRPERVFFSVGEPSGDEHTARLIRSMRARNPLLHARGFGGPEMRSAGCAIDFQLTDLAVVGLLNVLPKLRQFFRVADIAERQFASGSVDAVVLVDFPGFNWHIAKRAKKHGLPVFYYLPPQLWAWGGWRIRKMRRYVDHVLSVLPFEHEWFRQRNINTTCVGHPFFDAVAAKPLDRAAQEQIKPDQRPVVAILPGSRDHEVRENWPLMLNAIRRLNRQHPQLRFQVANYCSRHSIECRDLQNQGDADLPIHYFVDRTSEVIQQCDVAMMVSGSVSLELLARNKPAVVLYRVGRFFHAVAKRLVKIDSITLPNLMAGEPIYPEIVSSGNPRAAEDFLFDEVSRWLDQTQDNQIRRDKIARLRDRYATGGGIDQAARVIEQLIRGVKDVPDDMTSTGTEKPMPMPPQRTAA